MSKDPFSTSQPIYYQPPKQRGCFFYGCLITIIVLVLGVGVIGTVAYMTYRTIANTLLEYSEDSALPIPKVELAPDARASLDARVKAFQEGFEAGKPTEPLVLNSDELNTLIAEGVEGMGDRVHVDIVDDKLEGRLSLPIEQLDLFGLFGLKGKFVNAKGRFKVSLENGVLIVVLDDAEVKGKPLPDAIMEKFRKDNLAQEAYKEPKNAEILRKIESITLKDGKVTIKAFQKTPPADAKDAPAEGTEKPKDEKPQDATSKSEKPTENAQKPNEPNPQDKPKDATSKSEKPAENAQKPNEPNPQDKPKEEKPKDDKPKDEPKKPA